jgi:hypothetical protein
MSITLKVATVQGDYAIELSRTDYDLLSMVAEKCKFDLDVTSSKRSSIPCSKVALVEALDEIYTKVRMHLDNTAIYQYRIGCHPFAGDNHKYESGMFSGIKMPGDNAHRYAIKSGIDYCCMIKMELQQSGPAIDVGEVDLRDRTEITTENMGKISIRKKIVKSKVLSTLESLMNYIKSLADNSDCIVTIQ